MRDSSLPLSSLVEGFIFSLSAEGKLQSTVDYYKSNLRRFLWYVKQHNWPDDPRAIDNWKIREFLAYAGKATNRWGAIGNGSENCRMPSKTGGWRYYRTLRAFFRWAVSEGLLEQSPLDNIKIKPSKKLPVEPYTAEEVKALLSVCDLDSANGDNFLGSRNKAIIMLFVDSGMRLSELTNLRLTDISLETGRAVVTGKGGWQRTVAFSAATRKVIWKYLAFRNQRVKSAAKREFAVDYRCSVCGGLITINTENEKKAAAQYMREKGWGHGKCVSS
jgi:site-specific recombinase XerD